jgi:hypothetical protein
MAHIEFPINRKSTSTKKCPLGRKTKETMGTKMGTLGTICSGRKFVSY